jgi:hypothetical protein
MVLPLISKSKVSKNNWSFIVKTIFSSGICWFSYKVILWPWPFTNDLGSRSWHFLGSSVTILWNIIPIHVFSENLWPGQCFNHYEHSDHNLWPITLDQGHDTSLGPRQQSCEILFKSIKRVRNYGPDNLFAYVLTIMCIVTLTFDQWPWINVMTLPWVQCNNSVK